MRGKRFEPRSSEPYGGTGDTRLLRCGLGLRLEARLELGRGVEHLVGSRRNSRDHTELTLGCFWAARPGSPAWVVAAACWPRTEMMRITGGSSLPTGPLLPPLSGWLSSRVLLGFPVRGISARILLILATLRSVLLEPLVAVSSRCLTMARKQSKRPSMAARMAGVTPQWSGTSKFIPCFDNAHSSSRTASVLPPSTAVHSAVCPALFRALRFRLVSACLSNSTTSSQAPTSHAHIRAFLSFTSAALTNAPDLRRRWRKLDRTLGSCRKRACMRGVCPCTASRQFTSAPICSSSRVWVNRADVTAFSNAWDAMVAGFSSRTTGDRRQKWPSKRRKHGAQELSSESRGGRPVLPVPNSPYSLCGRKGILENRAQEQCESRNGRPGLPVPNSPYSLCGRKATLNSNLKNTRLCCRQHTLTWNRCETRKDKTNLSLFSRLIYRFISRQKSTFCCQYETFVTSNGFLQRA